MSKVKTAFCFAYTPFHAYFLEQMDFSAYDRVYLINLSRKAIVLRGNCQKIVLMNGEYRFFKFLRFFMFLLFARYYLSLRKDLFLPHPHHEASNSFFFSEKTVGRYLIQDGIANYYDAELDVKFERKIIFRLRFMRILGFKKYIKSHDFFASDLVDKVFVFFPKKLTLNMLNKGVRVFPLQSSIELVRGSLLFLEQPISGLFEEKKRATVSWALRPFFKAFDRVFVKEHHDGVSDVFFDMKDKIIRDESWGKVTAEELFLSLKPEVVSSYISSALVNIKAMNSDVQVVAHMPVDQILRRNGKVVLMKDFFEMFDVEVRVY